MRLGGSSVFFCSHNTPHPSLDVFFIFIFFQISLGNLSRCGGGDELAVGMFLKSGLGVGL